MGRKFTAFHGTIKDNVPSIISNGFRIKKYSFLTSQLQDVPGDLGAGVYAYNESEDNATAFAKKFGDNSAVLKLEITVDDNKYLDMDTKENTKLVLDVYNGPMFTTLKRRYENTKGSRSRECLDGLIIEHIIHKARINVDLIKKDTYTKFEGMPRTSHFNNGVELCIKESEIINEIIEIK